MSILQRRRVAVLTNPRSGMNTRRAGLAKTLGSYLSSPQWVYAPETLHELDTVAADIRRCHPDILAIVGGDGTAHQALTRLIFEHETHADQPLPQVLIIPTGSTNNLAWTLGMTRWSAVDLCRRLEAKLASGTPFETTPLAPLRVGDAYGFTLGAGLPNVILERYYASGAGGPAGALKILLGLLAQETLALLPPRRRSMSPLPSEVRLIDGTEERRSPYDEHTIILAGAFETIGLGCLALPDARRDPGKFMVRASALSLFGLVANARAIRNGQPLPKTFGGTAAHAIVGFEQLIRPLLDGDFLPPTREVTITTGPALTFVTG
jgi:hypothetical protein